MTTLAEERLSERQSAGWDALVAVLLGVALLAAGWLDVRAFLAHRNTPLLQFALMDPLVASMWAGTRFSAGTMPL